MKQAYLSVWRDENIPPMGKLLNFLMIPFMRPFFSKKDWINMYLCSPSTTANKDVKL